MVISPILLAGLVMPTRDSDGGVAELLHTLRDVLGQAAAIVQRLRISSAEAHLLSVLATELRAQVGVLAERENDRIADLYLSSRDAVRALTTPSAEPGATSTPELLAHRAARAHLVGARPCAMHDWIAAPPNVGAVRICRNCPAESQREVSA